MLIKKIKIAGNNPLIRQWWYDILMSRPPPLPKNEEKYREATLDRVEEGWLGEEWARTMPQLISELLQKNFTFTSNPTSTRVPHATEGIQRIRMEELGKALTNRCRDVRELYCQTKNREIWRGPGIETPTVNSLNLNANSKRPHGAASMNSSI